MIPCSDVYQSFTDALVSQLSVTSSILFVCLNKKLHGRPLVCRHFLVTSAGNGWARYNRPYHASPQMS